MGFYFDGTRCIGCKTCELACKDYKNLSTAVTFRNVFEYSGGTWTINDDDTYSTDAFKYFTSVACNHCDMPACLAACPTGAISKSGDEGIVLIDEEICIGCGSCAAACPYHAPSLDDETTKGLKCDSCQDRRAEGKGPICVEACLTRAIEFGSIEELRSKYGNVDDVAPLPDPAQTQPNLIVRPSTMAKPFNDTTGHISNPKEIM
ncbi:MAG: dimethylsulfoxide reductase subunit B [Coriobacteriales bacterium]|nr:dimethylsulfoxide reductase subunit B [Coriobacteriales bacterium]